MKHVLLFTTMIFCLIGNAFGEESYTRLSILGESMENGTAATVGISSGADFVYGGVSFSHITSSKVIQYSDRQEIFPVYVFFGLKAPWILTPFVEAGFDFGDALIDDLYGDEDDKPDLVDYYYSGGLAFSATDKISLLLYAKKYNFKFQDHTTSATIKARPDSYGLGVAIRF